MANYYFIFFYMALACILVPIFRDAGHFGWTYAKDRLFLLLSCVSLAIGGLYSGLPPAGSGPLLPLILFVVMMGASALWSDDPRGTLSEALRWGSLCILSLMASQAPLDFVLLAVFLPAPFMALYGLSNQWFKRDFLDKDGDEVLINRKKRTSVRGWLGNSNYVSAYLVPCFFIGFHLTVSMSYWFIAGLIPIWLCLAWCYCRAGWASTIVGFGIALGIFRPEYVPFAVIFLFVLVLICLPRIEPTIGRWFYLLVCIRMFLKKPLWGWGPGAFRRNYFKVQAELNQKDPAILGNLKEEGLNNFPIGENAHNDHAENLVDVGLIGYGLFIVWIIMTVMSGSSHPFLIAGFLAAVVHGFLFFNFRMSGTAIPIFAMAGVMAGPGGFLFYVPLFISIPGTLILLAIIYNRAWLPFKAGRYFHKAVTHKKPQVQMDYLHKALHLEPYRNTYLYRLAVLYATVDPALSMFYAARLLSNYDGEKIEWWVWDLFSRTAYTNGAYDLALRGFQNAIYLNPSFKPAHAGLQMTAKIIQKINEEIARKQKEQHGKAQL